MKAGEQKEWLERLDRCVDRNFAAEMLSVIDPMSDAEIKMLDEALSVDPPGTLGRHNKAWKSAVASGQFPMPPECLLPTGVEILMRSDVFDAIVSINAGLRKAVELDRARGW
jgi:hypothetical protein